MGVFGDVAAVCFGLTLLFAVVHRFPSTLHRLFGVLTLLAAVVQLAQDLPEPGWKEVTACGGLLLLFLTSRHAAPRRAGTSRTREKRAGSLRSRFPALWHALHGLLTVATAVAILPPDPRLLLIGAAGVALYVLRRRIPQRTPPRHLRTADLPVTEHETGAVLRTAPVLDRPEKVCTPLHRVAVTTPDALPLALATGPDTVFIHVPNPNLLLTQRRALALAGGKARYFRSLYELRPLPELTRYVLCGSPDFVHSAHMQLAQYDVPPECIHYEMIGLPFRLPADHPSAPMPFQPSSLAQTPLQGTFALTKSPTGRSTS